MAKLKAHGYEVARVTIHEDPARPLWDTDTTTRRETVLSFRSDGHIMRREVSVNLHGDGGRTDHGWKLYRRFSDRRITPDRIREFAAGLAGRHEARGTRIDRKGC